MDKKKIFDAWRPFGDVLQLGFEPAMAAEIHKIHPKSHWIAESVPLKREQAEQWAKKHPSAQVHEDLGAAVFDSVYFEDQSSGKFDTLQQGKTLVEEIGQRFPEMAQMRYADAELDAFCQAAQSASKESLSRFLSELEGRGQISPEQRKSMSAKYHLKAARPLPSPSQAVEWIKLCLNGHTRKGSRIACFLPRTFDDSRFLNEIVADPFLETREIDVSATAFLVVIEKLS